MNLPRTYQEEQWIKGGRRPEYKKFIGKPVISWTQVEGWTAKRGFNTRTSPGRKEYIRKYFLGEEFKDKGWREFGTDVEDYITTRNEEAAQKFTIDEVSTLDQIEPLGVFQDEIVIDFGSFCLLGYIDDYTPPDHNNRVRVLRDYKTKSENSKKDLHQKDKFQLELYILGLQRRGLHIERAEYLIIERLGGRDCMNGKGRNSLSVGSRIWKEEYHFDQVSIDRAKSVVKKVAQEISDYYTLFQRINGIKPSDKVISKEAHHQSSEINPLPKKSSDVFSFDDRMRFNIPTNTYLSEITEVEFDPFWDYDVFTDSVNSTYPDGFFDLINLEKVNLSLFEQETIPAEITQFNNLTTLWLYNNGLTSLSPEIGKLSNLETLRLSKNNLTFLPPEIGELSNLKSLSLSQNNLTSLPREIGELSNLKSLDLSQNDLTSSSLPREIGELSNLKWLYLSRNHLFSLPREIGQLSNLKGLHLSHNHLTSLPREIVQLSKLTSLRIGSNPYSSIPIEILGELTSLRSLGIAGLSLKKLPTLVGQLSDLRSLDLGSNNLLSLPAEILQFTNLNVLRLSHNQITHLPPDISLLSNLRRLILDNCPLIKLPVEIFENPNLEMLLIQNCPIDSLPIAIFELSSLERLDITGTHIRESTVNRLIEALPNCEINHDYE